MLKRLQDLTTGTSLARLIVGLVAAGFLIFAAISFKNAFRDLIFGNPDVAKAQTETVLADEIGEAAQQSGIEATNEIVRTYEYHTETTNIVREGQSNVRSSTTSEDVHGAGAATLCSLGLHDSCGGGPATP